MDGELGVENQQGPITRLVRVTARCVADDLGNDAQPADLRALIEDVIAGREDPDSLMFRSASELAHPLLTKADELVAGSNTGELIRAFTEVRLVKVKTSEHRGAIWCDSSGDWWLVAAGIRKDDGRGDFYREVAKYAPDAHALLPTGIDGRWKDLEQARDEELAEERTAHTAVLMAVFAAAADPGTVVTSSVFGSDLSVRVDPDEEGTYVLDVTWTFDQYLHVDRFPVDVLAMVPGRSSIDDWQHQPGVADDDLGSWWTLVPGEWVHSWAGALELDALIDDHWSPSNPSTNGSENFSHAAAARVVSCAYVLGIEITALCGARVVAHRDYERFPVCPKCEEALDSLRAERG